MEKTTGTILVFLLVCSSCLNTGHPDNYTPKGVMNRLHEDHLIGLNLDEFVEKYGPPYEVEDSVLNGSFNKPDFTRRFKDSLLVSLTYMRPEGGASTYNDVVIISLVNSSYGTTFVPVFSVNYVAR